MTPRTMEEEVFQLLRSEKKQLTDFYDLRLDSPLYSLTHPKVLAARIRFKKDPQVKPESFEHPRFTACFYSQMSSAEIAHTDISVKRNGTPSEVWSFLQNPQPTIFNFQELGSVAISEAVINQRPTDPEAQHVLAPWLNYALSPELWGPVGKWTRFHERLHVLFEKFQLLQGKDFPGFYPLRPEAAFMEREGFVGSKMDGQYVLQLNWTFPLSALKKIEKVVAQGAVIVHS